MKLFIFNLTMYLFIYKRVDPKVPTLSWDSSSFTKILHTARIYLAWINISSIRR